jgi:hypothetical protein
MGLQGDLEMYSEQNLLQRKSNRNHPDVVAILEGMWSAVKRHVVQDKGGPDTRHTGPGHGSGQQDEDGRGEYLDKQV